jgi:hypothetical protein
MTNEELIVWLSRKVAELEHDNLSYKKWWSEARNELESARQLIAKQAIEITNLILKIESQTES